MLVRHPLPGIGFARHGHTDDRAPSPTLRLGLSFASLWGVLSFSMCGLSFPAMAMPRTAGLANLFPCATYFAYLCRPGSERLSMIYSWMNYVALLIFMMLPFLVAHRLKIL